MWESYKRKNKDKNKESLNSNIKTIKSYKIHIDNKIEEIEKKANAANDKIRLQLEEKKNLLLKLPQTRNNIHERILLQKEIFLLEEKLLQKPNFEKVLMINKIQTTNESDEQEKTLVLLKELMPDNLIPFFLQKHLCNICSSKLIIKLEESRAVCTNLQCGYSQNYVQSISEFTEQEIKITNKINKRKSANFAPKKGEKKTKKNVAVTSEENKETDRLSLYIKFLNQFHELQKDVPKEVINKVLDSLDDVHLMSTVKVKPTPVGNILRKNGDNTHINMTQRIVKQINNEKNPVFTKSQITKFCEKFKKLEAVFNEQNFVDRSKFANFTYLTRQFCLNDGFIEKAKMFENHKTKDVVDDEDERIIICYKILNEREPGQWNLFKSR